MSLRPLGRSSLQVSPFCLGTITFGGASCDEPTACAILDSAVAHGVNFIDTADVYPAGAPGRSEEIIGRWLANRTGHRRRLILATKIGKGNAGSRGLSRHHLLTACDGALQRLQTDYLDVLFLHAPDPTTPVEETLEAVDTLTRAGKIRSFGVSNFSASRLERILAATPPGTAAPVAIQSRYNLFYRDIEQDLLPLCRARGLGVTVYHPLAGGLLTGKHRFDGQPAAGTRFAVMRQFGDFYQDAYWRKPLFDQVEVLRALSHARHIPMVQLALAWLLRQLDVSSIVLGTSSSAQFTEALGSLSVCLTAEDVAACNRLAQALPRDWHPASTDC